MLLSHFNGRRSIRSRWCTDKLFTASPATRLAAPTLDKQPVGPGGAVRQRKESVLPYTPSLCSVGIWEIITPDRLLLPKFRWILDEPISFSPCIVFILSAAGEWVALSLSLPWVLIKKFGCALFECAVRPAVSLFSHYMRRRVGREFFSSCLRRVGRVCITMFINNANTPMQVWKSVLRAHTRSWLTERAAWSLLTSLKFWWCSSRKTLLRPALEPHGLFCAITLRVSHCRQRRN